MILAFTWTDQIVQQSFITADNKAVAVVKVIIYFYSNVLAFNYVYTLSSTILSFFYKNTGGLTMI